MSLLMLCAARSAKNHRGGSVLWTPASLTTPPAMWSSDKSAITLDGGSGVYQWADLSTSGANGWFSNGVSQPFTGNPVPTTGQNGLRVLRFNSASSQVLSGSSNAKSLTKNINQLAIFFAASPTKNASASVQLGVSFSLGTSGNARAEIDLSSNAIAARQRRLDTDAVAIASVTQPDSNFHIYASEHDWTGQTVGLRIDGGTITSTATSQGSGATSNTASQGVGLMGSPISAGAYLSGDVGEVIVLKYIPSLADRQMIEGYLAWKWGLQANLPSGHPYKSAPPYV